MVTSKGLKLLFGVFSVVLGAIVAAIVTAQNRRAGNRRLAEIDSGQRCISCNGVDVRLVDDVITCGCCGHVASLAALRKASPSRAELEGMYRPDDWDDADP